MLDINVELFKKQSAKKKLEIVENLTTEELLMTSVDTVKRILKEVGEKQGKSNMEKNEKQTCAIRTTRLANFCLFFTPT